MKTTTFDRFCETRGVRITSTYGGEIPEGFSPDSHPYRVQLRYKGRQLTCPFFQGSAITDDPTAAGVLHCLISDSWAGNQSFEDWCADFGLYTDSRKAERTYKACVRLGEKVRRLLDEDFDAFQEAGQDY